MSEDKWIDDILGSSEKQDILIKVKQAIDRIEGMKIPDALDLLYDLRNDLDEGFDKEKAMSMFEKSLRESVGQAMHHHHNHEYYDARTGRVGVTSTYTVTPVEQRLLNEIADMKRDMRDLYYVIRSLQGNNLSLPDSVRTSGAVAVPQMERERMRLSEEEIRSLLR